MQERLIREITIAYLKMMFKDDLIANLDFLCKKFNITEMFDTISCLFPRRVSILFITSHHTFSSLSSCCHDLLSSPLSISYISDETLPPLSSQ